MGIVGRPHEAVSTDELHDEGRRRLVGVAGDEALAAEVLAGRLSQVDEAAQVGLIDGVHAVQERPDPARPRLQHTELEPGKAFQGPQGEEGQERLLHTLAHQHVEVPLRRPPPSREGES